jgi:hypothetical protein
MILESSNFETVIQRRSHTETYAILGFWKLQPRWKLFYATSLSISPLLQHSFHTKGNYVKEDYWWLSDVLNLGFVCVCVFLAVQQHETGYSRINLLNVPRILLGLNPKSMHEWDLWHWWSSTWDLHNDVGLSWIFEKWWLSKFWSLATSISGQNRHMSV